MPSLPWASLLPPSGNVKPASEGEPGVARGPCFCCRQLLKRTDTPQETQYETWGRTSQILWRANWNALVMGKGAGDGGERMFDGLEKWHRWVHPGARSSLPGSLEWDVSPTSLTRGRLPGHASTNPGTTHTSSNRGLLLPHQRMVVHAE